MPIALIRKIVLSALTVILLVIIFQIFLFKPRIAEISKLNKKHAEVLKLLETSKGYVSRYKSVRAAVDSMSVLWASLSECLPNKEEMPYLLRGIAEAGKLSNVQFVLFRPLPLVSTGFYVENPVYIKVNCTYHELGYFLSKISSLERLVNVTKFKLSSAKKSDKFATVEFTATAYTIPDSLPAPKATATASKPKEKAKDMEF